MESFSGSDELPLDKHVTGDWCAVSLQDERKSCIEVSENIKKLKAAQEITSNMYSRLFSDKRRAEDTLDHSDLGSDVECLSQTNSNSDLLNKSVGSMQSILAKNARDHVRDFAGIGSTPESPKVTKGVQLNLQTCVHRYDLSSSENEESEIERYKENRAVTIHNDTRQSAMARIEDMWDAFTVDDYAPWPSFRESVKLQRSQSLMKVDSDSQKNPKVYKKKKTTVPNPPAMLLREVNKTPRKTKAMIELDQMIEEKKRLEDLECKKQFRATPAPQHVHLRLFSELMRQQEERRHLLRENREEILKSRQKPFEFQEREEKKKENRKETGKPRRRKPSFRARPFPAHIFSGTVEDRILEEEEYRRIRMRIRAEELLNSSVAPYSIRIREKPEKKSRHRGGTAEHSFHPKVNQSIPDLDEQYQQFLEQMIRSKAGKKPTACEPFNLRLSKPKKHRLRNKAPGGGAEESSLGSPSPSSDLSSANLKIEKEDSQKRKPTEKGLAGKTERSSERKSPSARVDVDSGSDDSLEKRDAGDGYRWEESMRETWMSKTRQLSSDDDEEYRHGNRDTKVPMTLNQTRILDDSDARDSTKEPVDARSDFWCHPLLIKRSEFWSNPATVVK